MFPLCPSLRQPGSTRIPLSLQCKARVCLCKEEQAMFHQAPVSASGALLLAPSDFGHRHHPLTSPLSLFPPTASPGLLLLFLSANVNTPATSHFNFSENGLPGGHVRALWLLMVRSQRGWKVDQRNRVLGGGPDTCPQAASSDIHLLGPSPLPYSAMNPSGHFPQY